MQANSTSGDFDTRVRQRLRELRMQRGLTLEDVAARASIDISTLSRLESGKRRLALDHLPRLAEALSVCTDELLRAPEAPHPPAPRASAPPPRASPRGRGPTGAPAGGLHAFKVRISIRRRKPPAELPIHEGQEWIYVLSGRLRLILGEREFTIEPGEAVEFSTWTPHWFGVVDDAVGALMIFGGGGEGGHLPTGR